GCRTEALVKLHPALIPSGDPPFDHSATALLSFSGNSFHQLFPYSSASMSIGNVELLDDEIRLRSISEGNKVINKNSDDGGVIFRNKTMKIRRRTPKSLFAKQLLGDGKIVRVFLKLGEFAHQRQQAWNIGFDCFSDFQRCHE